jgi:hypothetical protein
VQQQSIEELQRRYADKSAELMQQRQDLLDRMRDQTDQQQRKHQMEMDAMVQVRLLPVEHSVSD